MTVLSNKLTVPFSWLFQCVCLSHTEEEYKRLSEALADEGTYNSVGFRYSADYYDPSQPTEEEEANRETGEHAHWFI